MRKSTLKFCEDEIPWFDRKDWPLLVDILNTVDRNPGGVFLIRGSIQSFKSLAAQLILMADIVLRPGRWAWYGATGDDVKAFADEKLNELYDNLPILRRLEPRDRNRIQKLSKRLPHMLLTLLSARTKGDRQSKTLRNIVMDEAWHYSEGEVNEIWGRVTNFEKDESFKIIIPTSGETKGSEVNEIWEDSDKRTWHVQCPLCEHWFYPDVYPPAAVERFDDATGKPTLEQPPGGLQFDASDAVRDGQGRIVQRLFDGRVFYQCPNPACAGHLSELPLETSTYISLSPEPAARNVVGWTWNALYHMPMASVALLKAKADDALKRGSAYELEEFDRKRAVRPWSLSSVVNIADRPSCVGNYVLGEAWSSEYFRVMTIDVQLDHYYWKVRIWARDTSSRLLVVGVAWSEEQLREAQRKWGLRGHGGHIVEHPKTGQIYFAEGCDVFIDGNYDTARVRRLAARNHWCVLRGEQSGDRYPHADGKARIWNPIQAIEAFSGVVEDGGESADQFVAEIRFRKNSARDTLRLLQNTKNPEQVWTYSRDVEGKHPDYIKHLAAWSPRDKLKSKDSLETVTEWKKVHERDDWEWCECASIIAAHTVELIGGDAVEVVSEEENQ